MQTIQKPGVRLSAALPYLTRGGTLADIGTDHALLPIRAVAQGFSSRAVACDINRGPLESAKKNIEAAELTQSIDTLQTDGLHGVEPYAPDDVLVFGMGGELIVRILSQAPWVKNVDIGLVLQPMTRASLLRRWLSENGFAVTGESIVFEDKYYQIIAARYTGVPERHTDAEYAVGWQNIAARPPLFEGFVRHEIKVLQKIVLGKSRAKDADAAEERALIKQLEELL